MLLLEVPPGDRLRARVGRDAPASAGQGAPVDRAALKWYRAGRTGGDVLRARGRDRRLRLHRGLGVGLTAGLLLRGPLIEAGHFPEELADLGTALASLVFGALPRAGVDQCHVAPAGLRGGQSARRSMLPVAASQRGRGARSAVGPASRRQRVVGCDRYADWFDAEAKVRTSLPEGSPVEAVGTRVRGPHTPEANGGS